MKRIFSILLCLMLMFSITACKPDNITYPSDITDPNETVQGDPDQTEPSDEQETAGEETPDDETTEETPETPEDQPVNNEEAIGEETDEPEKTPADEADEETAEEATEETAEETPVTNPLAAEDFTPSAAVAGSLPTSGIIKPGAAVSALKNRTITLYTADEQPAFSYTDENGKAVSEWAWMEKLANENGFMLKYQIKNSAVSLKSQRVALFAGQKLSLVQIAQSELGNGMTLAASAAELLNLETASYGISKAVLQQSNHKLFAPVGNIESLWYDPAALPEGTDLKAMTQENKWTVEQFKTICDGSQAARRLEMNALLPWATLGGRSPLTLLEGKLDSNLHAAVTQEAWTAVKALDLNALQLPKGSTEQPETGALFTYTNAPTAAEGQTLQYAPLPALQEGTAGTVTFAGTFLALPKYETDTEALRAALTFAELWCNRYTETRAATLQTLGIKGADYQAYCDLAETRGMLILYAPELQKAAEPYLSGLTDPAVDMDAAYKDITPAIEGLLAARNLYY